MMSISLNGGYGVETADETVCLRGAVVTPLEVSRMSWSRYRIMFVLGYAKTGAGNPCSVLTRVCGHTRFFLGGTRCNRRGSFIWARVGDIWLAIGGRLRYLA